MEWMYKGINGLVDREEYLKGRKVDKTFEILEREENNIKTDFDSIDAQIPQSIFSDNNYSNNNNSGTTVTVDLATKLREDPLYEIRLKQREQRRQLLSNPIKLKKLKSILESTLTQHKPTNNNKHSKRSKRDSSEESSQSDPHRSRRKSGQQSDGHRDHRKSRQESDRHRDHRKGDEESHRHRDHRKSGRNSSHRESDSHKYKNIEPNRERERNSYNYRDYHKNDDKKYEHKRRTDDKNRNDYQKYSSRSHESKHKSNQMSNEELERRRKEMMENAIWREENRKRNVKSYNEEELKEKQFNDSSKCAQFIKPLLKNVAESDSLEKRIKQKRFTSQRSYNSMDTNFAKRT
jgi:hypothetical protein